MNGNGEPPRAVVHSFRERLEYSASLSDEEAWVQFYRQVWPDMAYAVRVDVDGQGQRDGIDRVVYLASGKQFRIDEKKRETTFDDVLLEDWSVWYGEGNQRNKIGWALDGSKRCDYVAYAIPALGKCYLLPFEFLRIVFQKYHDEWERLRSPFGRTRDAKNRGYVTRNIAVPPKTLLIAIVSEMRRDFCGQRLTLPTPFEIGDQIVFAWE